MFEKDFKKVVAMSTLRQLGFIVFSLSLGFTLFSFLHIIFHAFFKSSLFLATGNLIHYLSGGQDSRFFGSLGSSFFSKLIFNVSCLSLIGFPFTLGFYSKDLVLGSAFFSFFNFFFFFFLVSCLFTVGYSFRLIHMRFLGFPIFSVSISFSDLFYFFFPIFFLYVFCVFLGNFFFYFFSFPLMLSIVDCFSGVIVFLLGYILFCNLPYFYMLDCFLGRIGFLTFFVRPLLVRLASIVSFKLDYTWSEVFGSYVFLGFSNILRIDRLLFYFSFTYFIIFLTIVILVFTSSSFFV